MKNTNCDVIRDLLPLYKDGVASPDSRNLVEQHLDTCPACRAELEKMGAPVSLPPDEDAELLRRFNLERQEKLRRKRRFKLACAGAAALILVLCLWYTWPRSWRDVASAQGEEVTDLAASIMSVDVQEGNLVTDNWLLDAEQAQGAATQAILNALDRWPLRASLRNLIPYRPDSRTGITGVTILNIELDNAQYAALTVYGDGLVYSGGDYYYASAKLYQELERIIQQYGTSQAG